jgi:hypothetical protein
VDNLEAVKGRIQAAKQAYEGHGVAADTLAQILDWLMAGAEGNRVWEEVHTAPITEQVVVG